jgi:chromosome segregation ATPase
MKIFLVFLCLLFAASTGVFGWLYFQESNQGDNAAVEASSQIAGLQANIGDLQGQLKSAQNNVAVISTSLAAEKDTAVNLTGQLAKEKDKSAGLEFQLSTITGDQALIQSRLSQLQNDLDASKAVVAGLTADLAASAGKVVNLQNDLADAQSKATRLQTSLDAANNNLAAATASAAKATAELNKIKDPRHFNSVDELTTWLAKDDTNTNPAYKELALSEKAFILQVRALRDGYLLPAGLDADASYIYSWNSAVVNGTLFIVNANDDTITNVATFPLPPAAHPLPVG